MIHHEARSPSVDLPKYLAARMLPLAVLLASVVAVSAPLAYYVLGMRALQAEVQSAAEQASRTISREASDRPNLWRYDSIKLVEHLRAYRTSPNITWIEVVDDTARPIGTTPRSELDALGQRSLLWASAPVTIHAQEIGRVWAAAETKPVRDGAVRLLVPFLLLGCGLASLMYWLPIGAVRDAEKRIAALFQSLEQSQIALAGLNESLEREVSVRSRELSLAYEELKRKEERLRELSAKAIGLQEGERKRIGRELHDSTGQAMTAIRLQLQIIRERPETSEHVRALAARAIGLVDSTLEEVRRAVAALGPAILHDVGLGPAVRRLADDFSERTDIKMGCTLDGLPDGLPAAVETACYRIVQETLTNVARHARASRVSIGMVAIPERISVTVEDDGIGFEVETSLRSDTHGLVGMRERVELLGGAFELTSSPGRGTRLHVELPLMGS